MIKTTWDDPNTGKSYSYSWGYDISDMMPPIIRKMNTPDIGKVIFNPPATIVLWSDGTKTVVKCSEDDDFDPEKGLAMAVSKKFFGNKGAYYKNFKKWLPDQELGYPTIPEIKENLKNIINDLFVFMGGEQ